MLPAEHASPVSRPPPIISL